MERYEFQSTDFKNLIILVNAELEFKIYLNDKSKNNVINFIFMTGCERDSKIHLMIKIYRMVLFISFSAMLKMHFCIASGQNTKVLIDDSFSSSGDRWKEVRLNGANKGSFSMVNHKLTILNQSQVGAFGLYNLKSLSGNFYAEAEFAEDDIIGLALIAGKNGIPDTANYTMLAVSNRSGVTYVNQYDKQNHINNVHDPKKIIDPARYEARLDSMTFSVPYRSTNKKIRILHEALSNTFHFYYGTRLTKWGITSNDWMELAPQYSWLDPGQEYFLALVGRASDNSKPKPAFFTGIKVVQTPTDDADDNKTGFRAVRRAFSWSGFDGEAIVLTFGKDFDYDKNIKFVLWDRANNAPVWRLTNQFLLSFEFFESGDSLYPGCHEAMSDRQRHGQSVTIVENNDVRKIIHWHGIPLNPNYDFAGENFKGNQYPYFDEYWTFYPDGTGTRQMIDMPNLDINHRRIWGPEIIELMAIGGSLVEAGDLCNSPALSVFSMKDSVKTYFPEPANHTYAKDSWGWDQIVYDSHFKNNLPDFYLVYSQSKAYPELWSGIKIETQIDWHNTTWNFSHWPVGREPYGQNAADWGKTSRSYASNKNEVTHTSLVSAGFYRVGLDFNENFQVDSEGRRFRRHVMLVGVSKPYNYDEVRNQIQTWLDPGKITMLDNNCDFVKIDRIYRSIIFKLEHNNKECNFSIKPNKTIVNPSFTIENWKGDGKVDVLLNGSKANFRMAKEGSSLLVWVQKTLTQETNFSIRSENTHKH
jgi:hypothetical protein